LRERFDLRIGRSRCSLLLSFFLVAFKWGPQVRRISRISPRYLIWVSMRITIPSKWKTGDISFLKVEGTWKDFLTLILIFQLDAHFYGYLNENFLVSYSHFKFDRIKNKNKNNILIVKQIYDNIFVLLRWKTRHILFKIS